jgi:hypothetical protein
LSTTKCLIQLGVWAACGCARALPFVYVRGVCVCDFTLFTAKEEGNGLRCSGLRCSGKWVKKRGDVLLICEKMPPSVVSLKHLMKKTLG